MACYPILNIARMCEQFEYIVCLLNNIWQSKVASAMWPIAFFHPATLSNFLSSWRPINFAFRSLSLQTSTSKNWFPSHFSICTCQLAPQAYWTVNNVEQQQWWQRLSVHTPICMWVYLGAHILAHMHISLMNANIRVLVKRPKRGEAP